MAGKAKTMSQIKQLLRLRQQGHGKKKIAGILRIGINTVRTYLRKLEGLDEDIETLLALEDPVLNARFHAGNPSYKEERYGQLKDDLGHYHKELNRKGVTKQLLWEEYREAHPQGYSHSQFCYHLYQYSKASKPTLPLTHLAGEKLLIDYAGDTIAYIDPDTGEVIDCQVFVASLAYSDYCFAMAVRSQNVNDFIYALSCCLNTLGGVPKALVPDNLKAAVIKPDLYEPRINQALEDFANHYNTTVVPARVRRPQDKAGVEKQVSIIYNRIYARLRKRQFLSLQELNEAFAEKVKQHNQTRKQKLDYCREEKFLAEEKHLLAPLPLHAYEMKQYREYKAGVNNHIYLGQDGHYYSVPYTLIGQQLKVVYTRSKVSIYYNGQCVAMHARCYSRGHYTTVKEHLCSAHQHYISRSPEYYLDMAAKKSGTLRQLFDLLFQQNRYPEQQYRTCDGLLRLQRNNDADKFEKACRVAIDNQCYSYRFVENILKNNMAETEKNSSPESLPQHQNIRGKSYFEQTQMKINFS